jgi:acyl-CoA thioester hydrolase
MNEYSTTLELRIDWSEIDSLGHINNLAIMRYVQTARVNYLERLGLMASRTEVALDPVMASTSCQFKKQLFYPGNVVVHSRISHMKTTSFHMEHAVFNDAGELVAEASDVLVMFDFRRNVKQPIPALLREKIQALEGGAVTCGPLARP